MEKGGNVFQQMNPKNVLLGFNKFENHNYYIKHQIKGQISWEEMQEEEKQIHYT